MGKVRILQKRNQDIPTRGQRAGRAVSVGSSFAGPRSQGTDSSTGDLSRDRRITFKGGAARYEASSGPRARIGSKASAGDSGQSPTIRSGCGVMSKKGRRRQRKSSSGYDVVNHKKAGAPQVSTRERSVPGTGRNGGVSARRQEHGCTRGLAVQNCRHGTLQSGTGGQLVGSKARRDEGRLVHSGTHRRADEDFIGDDVSRAAPTVEGSLHTVLSAKGSNPTLQSNRTCARGNRSDERSQVVEQPRVVHRSIPLRRMCGVGPSLASAHQERRRATRVSRGNSSAASERAEGGGSTERSEATASDTTAGYRTNLAVETEIRDTVRCTIAEKTAFALLERWDYDYSTFLKCVERSSKSRRPLSRDGEWRQWDCDDFPKERLSYLVLNELAAQSGDEELLNRWRTAVKWINDPREWDVVDEGARNRVYAENRRATPNPCLERHLVKLVEAGILTKRARDRIKVFLTSFLIPKISKQRVRIIVNAIPTNDLLACIPKVVLPKITDVEELVRGNDFFVEYDGQSYYNQYALGDAVKAFFGLRVGKENYVWSTGPMGWAPMVFIGQAGTEVLIHDKEDHVDVSKLAYIDNVYFWGRRPHESELRNSQVRFESRCKRANAKFSVTKDLSPTGDVLGLFVDCEKKTVSLQGKFVSKLRELLANAELFFNDGVVGLTHRHIWKLFGSIMWGARILRIPFHQYPDFWFWIRRRAGYLTKYVDLWDRECKMPANAIRDVRRLLARLIENRPYELLKHDPDQTIELYVDASGSGIGACIPTADAFMSRHLPKVKDKVSIAYYELYALVAGLKWAKKEFPAVKNWKVFTDNTNVEAWVRKGVGPTYIHTKLLSELSTLGSFTLHRVASANNFADKPSRIAAAPRLA